MGPLWQPCRVPLLPFLRRAAARGRRRRRGADVVRRLGGPPVHPAAGHRAPPAGRARAAAGAAPVSDIHMAPDQRAKQEWLRGLADLEPDLVINTGDNLAHSRSVPVVADSLGGLLDLPGVYVFGSNDYCAPGLRNPLLYLLPDTGKRNTTRPPAAVARAQGALRPTAAGSTSATASGPITVGGTTIAFAGVDDPHLKYDDLAAVAGPADAGRRRAARRHACAVPPCPRPVRRRRLRRRHRRPHPRRAGLPARAVGALTTNCDLEPARARRAAPPPRRLAPRATPARRGCTSRPGSAPTRTSASGSPAGPRPR